MNVVCLFRPAIIKERLYCHAIIGRIGGKEPIMKTQVNCEFISPLVELSKTKISFNINKVIIYCFIPFYFTFCMNNVQIGYFWLIVL